MAYKPKYNRRTSSIKVYTTYRNINDNGTADYYLRSVHSSLIYPGEMFALGKWSDHYDAYKIGYYAKWGWNYGYIKSTSGTASAFSSSTRTGSWRSGGITYSTFTLRKGAIMYRYGKQYTILGVGSQVAIAWGVSDMSVEKPWRLEIHGYRRPGGKWVNMVNWASTAYIDTGWFEGMTTKNSCRLKTYR